MAGQETNLTRSKIIISGRIKKLTKDKRVDHIGK